MLVARGPFCGILFSAYSTLQGRGSRRTLLAARKAALKALLRRRRIHPVHRRNLLKDLCVSASPRLSHILKPGSDRNTTRLAGLRVTGDPILYLLSLEQLARNRDLDLKNSVRGSNRGCGS